ncbi:MAG: TIGR01906 family membrane protein [Dehalococcoidia bacterium]|nr:TIGR01906 family membrane protein [Dehalococcoidia bacterium]
MRPDTTIPRPLKILVAVLFISLVPIFLIAFSVRWVINFPPLYSYGFDRFDIPSRTGIERAELISAGKQIRDYFNNDQEYLAVRVVVRGILYQNIYNEREVLHMKDVKALVQGVYRVSELTGLFLLAVLVGGLAIWGRRFLPSVATLIGWGGWATVGLLIVVGLAMTIGFDRLFLAFHLISFTNDLWQLDPRRDYLIAMFPEVFFFTATILIIVSVTFLSVCLIVASWIMRKKLQPATDTEESSDNRTPAQSALTR